MIASDFAPTVLSPVGYGIAELHRLLIDFEVWALRRLPAITLSNGDIFQWSQGTYKLELYCLPIAC